MKFSIKLNGIIYLSNSAKILKVEKIVKIQSNDEVDWKHAKFEENKETDSRDIEKSNIYSSHLSTS